MFTELAYVKERLKGVTRDVWRDCSKKTKVPFRTIARIGYSETPSPRSDTVGKIAMYFRTKEKRKST